MADTFILVTPAHCFSHKDYIAAQFEQLGVANARNVVGRIGNIWFRYNRIEKSLKDWERNRRAACQNLADTIGEKKHYKAEDRPEIIYDIKRAKEQRDIWHYKASLFSDLDELMTNLPTLYVKQEDLWEARKNQVAAMIITYNRRKKLRKVKRKQKAQPRS